MEQTQGCGYVYVKNVGPGPISLHLKRRIDLIPLGAVIGVIRPSMQPGQTPFVIDQKGQDIVIYPGHTLALREDELMPGRDVTGIRKLVDAGMLEILDPRTVASDSPLRYGGSTPESKDFVPNMAAYAKLQGRSWWKGHYGSHPEWFEWMTDEQRADASNPSLAPVEEIFIRCPHCDKMIPKSDGTPPTIREFVSEVQPRRSTMAPRPVRSAYRPDSGRSIPRQAPPPDPTMADGGWMGDKLIDGLVDRMPDVIENAKARIREREERREQERISSQRQGCHDDTIYVGQDPARCGHPPANAFAPSPSQTVSISKEKLGEVVAEVLRQVFDRLV